MDRKGRIILSYIGNYTEIPDWFPSSALTQEPSNDGIKEWNVGYKPPAQWRNWQDKGWFIALKNIDQALSDHEAQKSGTHNVGNEYIAKTSNPGQYSRKQEIVDFEHDNVYHTKDFETETGAQTKADTAENNANGYTDDEINNIDSNGDGTVDSADYAVNADNAINADNVTSTYKGNDIDTDGDGKVDNADNAVNADNATNADKLENNTKNDILREVYPVGSIYINSTDNTNPGTLLGFGTWTAFGAGRVPVGYNSGDSDFDTAEETGGEKEHTLTESELASHNHITRATKFESGTDVALIRDGDQRGSNPTDNTGGDSPHNNLQPYITVYMWKRTA
jgi:hypothetical protein